MGEQSETGGVKAFSIGGRLVRERERLLGMTDEERAWRAQYLKDLELSPREPVRVPALERELTHPLRRLYKFPLDRLQGLLAPTLGQDRALAIRWWTGKTILAVFGIYTVFYYFKYNAHDWTRQGGWHVYKSKGIVLPGEEGYPKLSDKTKPSDYCDRGFKNSPI